MGEGCYYDGKEMGSWETMEDFYWNNYGMIMIMRGVGWIYMGLYKIINMFFGTEENFPKIEENFKTVTITCILRSTSTRTPATIKNPLNSKSAKRKSTSEKFPNSSNLTNSDSSMRKEPNTSKTISSSLKIIHRSMPPEAKILIPPIVSVSMKSFRNLEKAGSEKFS